MAKRFRLEDLVALKLVKLSEDPFSIRASGKHYALELAQLQLRNNTRPLIGYVFGLTADGSAIYFSSQVDQDKRGIYPLDGRTIPKTQVKKYSILHNGRYRRF